MKLFSLSAITIATSLFSLNAVAADKALTVYGKANLSFQIEDSVESSTDLKSNSSRLGFKGEVELEGGLTAIYTAEFGVDFSDESKEQNITSRNQWVGLKGDFGQVRLGRMDTALKLAQGKIDQFNGYSGDIKHVFSKRGENRMSDTVTYISPNFSGFTAGLTYITQEETDSAEADKAGVSAAVMYGDAKLKKSDFYAAVAIDQNVKGYDVIRLATQVKLGALKLGAILQSQEQADVAGSSADEGVVLSAAYSAGQLTYKAQVQTINQAADQDAVSVGVDYKLGKNTKAFTWLTRESSDAANAVDTKTLAFGIEHKF